jgi:hypothetical protein
MKKSLKKQSTSKTKWDHQNSWVKSCEQDNLIGKTRKKTKLNSKKNQTLKDKIENDKKKPT